MKSQSNELVKTVPMPTLQGFEWRAATATDVPAIHRTLMAATLADGGRSEESLEDKQRQFADPWSLPERDTIVGIAPDGTVAVFGRTFMNPDPVDDERRLFILLETHPDYRGGDLTEAAYQWLEAQSRQRLKSAEPYQASVIRMGALSTSTDRIRMIERAGYQHIRTFFRMERDLRQPIPAAALASEFRVTTYQPEHSRPLWQAFNDSFSDHWSFEPVSDEDWQMFFIERSTFRPDLTRLIWDGDELAGYSINRIEPDLQRHAPVGWIGQLGVRRAWRKRGLATYLLCETMRAFQAEGLAAAGLGVDSENPTGALGVYERVGFTVAQKYYTYSISVPSGAISRSLE